MEIVGRSDQICRIRRIIEKLGRSSAPVLLLGESGTGKEVVARAIHEARGQGQFVPIDCGALVGPLMESELFGHTRGAFTGAAEAKKGLIELADGGTAFFDEIGDLRLDMQVKLLRLLQERQYRPVGSLLQKNVDIRVIAATHRDLAKEAAAGNFRQDLYYRLNVVTVHLPPLRERKADIPVLIEHFLNGRGALYRLAQEAMDAVISYPWPGNVRELQNCIERMVAMNSGPEMHIADLPTALHYHLKSSSPCALDEISDKPEDSPLVPCLMPLPEREKRAIIEALEFTRGDRVKAAHMLGIGRTTLYRKMKEYRIGN